jgi:peptide/nickel transport system substrate-binding protein
MDLQKSTRRDFLRLSAFATAGVALAACAQPTTPAAPDAPDAPATQPTTAPAAQQPAAPAQPQQPAEMPAKYSESPFLADRVASGALPPVDERLPEEPMVVYPEESVGQYGGTLRVGTISANLFGGDIGRVGPTVPTLLRISKDARGAVPNVLKDWEMSDDFMTLNLYFRKGMKWSDGAPVTADDWMFFWEDVMLNPDINPVVGQWFRVGGENMQVSKLDDYTVQIEFAAPNPSFVLVNLAHRYGMWGDNILPGHYLKEFHATYNDKANDLAKAGGFDFWYQYFGNRRNPDQNADVPHLRSHMVTNVQPDMLVLERNPYFWMVDPEGNQLPYIDRITADRVAEKSLLDAKAVAGQYDFCGMETNIQNYSTYDGASAQGNFRIQLWRSGKGSEVVYNVNMNWPEPAIRETFSDIRFRRALSVAINREEINDIIYYGNGTPSQMTVVPQSRFFKQEYADAWAQYDPDLANELLDEMGLEWDAQRRNRLFPNGQPLTIQWDLFESETPKGPITELVKEYWEAVGIQIEYQSVTRTLLTQKIQSNEEPMSTWHGDETMDTLFHRRPKFFAPIHGDESTWGQLWGQWYNTKGAEGEEPPDEIKALYDSLDNYLRTDEDQYGHIALASNAENLWTIGTIANGPHPLIVNNKLKNLSPDGFWTWDYLWAIPTWPEQLYFES